MSLDQCLYLQSRGGFSRDEESNQETRREARELLEERGAHWEGEAGRGRDAILYMVIWAFPRIMDCGLLGVWCHYLRLFEFTCNYLYSLNHDNKMLQEENYPTIHPSLSLSSIHQQINLPTSRLLRGSKTSPGIPVALFVEWYFISQKCLLPQGLFFLLRNKCFFS